MAGNCLLIISKNEGTNPIAIAHHALESDIIDKVIISDGSNENTFNCLKKKESGKIQVINEKQFVNTTEIGKGIGMMNGAVAAIRQEFDKIGFIDGDIKNSNISEWMELLFKPLDYNVDIVKAAFTRNPTDGQITRHITKPLVAMFLSNAWVIDQPLGGELSLKREVLEDIFYKGITPPYHWGIDTFITMKSLMYGYKMGEVYLGQKIHGKKTLTNLNKMFNECFEEAIRMIRYFYNLPVRKKINPIIEISSPYQKNPCFNEIYMDIKTEFYKSLDCFRLIKKMNLPNDDLFYDIKNVKNFDAFCNKTKAINDNAWVEELYWFVKKYNPMFLDQYYYRWKIRSLSYCLNEIQTIEQAENNVINQSKNASRLICRIGEKEAIESSSKKLYFYHHS